LFSFLVPAPWWRLRKSGSMSLSPNRKSGSMSLSPKRGALHRKQMPATGDHPTDLSRMNSSSESSPRTDFSGLRGELDVLLAKRCFEVFMGLVILSNVGFMVAEIDMEREMERGDCGPADCMFNQAWVSRVNISFLVIYCAELSGRLFVSRCLFFKDKWSIMDFVIVAIGLLELISGGFTLPFPPSALRFLRVLRLLRAYRLLVTIRELYLMVHGFISAMKAIIWASLLMLALITGWSVLAVFFLDGINQEIAKDGYYRDRGCQRCHKAFQSVMDANLTLLQTVVAGDSWGEVAVPIIEHSPWTVAIFTGIIVTVQLVLMNLILAVIVDRAAEARIDDARAHALLKKSQCSRAQKRLLRICAEMDEDSSGTLTLQELLAGYETSEEFAAELRVMDVDQDDLTFIFGIIDQEGHGFVTYHDFTRTLHKIKTQDSRTMLTFVNYYVLDVANKIRSLETCIRHFQGEISTHTMTMKNVGASLEGSVGLSRRNSWAGSCEAGWPTTCPFEAVTECSLSATSSPSPCSMKLAHDMPSPILVDETSCGNSPLDSAVLQSLRGEMASFRIEVGVQFENMLDRISERREDERAMFDKTSQGLGSLSARSRGSVLKNLNGASMLPAPPTLTHMASEDLLHMRQSLEALEARFFQLSCISSRGSLEPGPAEVDEVAEGALLAYLDTLAASSTATRRLTPPGQSKDRGSSQGGGSTTAAAPQLDPPCAANGVLKREDTPSDEPKVAGIPPVASPKEFLPSALEGALQGFSEGPKASLLLPPLPVLLGTSHSPRALPRRQ